MYLYQQKSHDTSEKHISSVHTLERPLSLKKGCFIIQVILSWDLRYEYWLIHRLVNIYCVKNLLETIFHIFQCLYHLRKWVNEKSFYSQRNLYLIQEIKSSFNNQKSFSIIWLDINTWMRNLGVLAWEPQRSCPSPRRPGLGPKGRAQELGACEEVLSGYARDSNTRARLPSPCPSRPRLVP